MVLHLDQHPLFERVQDVSQDPCVRCVLEETEEGKKVARNFGQKFLAVYKRVSAMHEKEWTGFDPLCQDSKESQES